jgi:hypothetical protein
MAKMDKRITNLKLQQEVRLRAQTNQQHPTPLGGRGGRSEDPPQLGEWKGLGFKLRYLKIDGPFCWVI